MEPAKINWQTLESVFVRDDTFENINAPQWVDFLAPDHSSLLDDEAWFCRPDCKHPKTPQDFLKSTPPSKLFRSAAVSKLIALGDWSRIREVNLKRRVPPPQQDEENRSPNLAATPLSQHIKPDKATIKSSAEKGIELKEKELSDIPLNSDENGTLKSVLSGRDQFVGRDLLGKITDFCNELKKMAAITRAKEKDECENSDAEEIRVRKPFDELSKESHQGGVRSSLKERPRKHIVRGDDDAENTPLSLDLKNGKAGKMMEGAIRTWPPTPQGFSATRETVKSTPSKAPKSKLKERQPFQEIQLKQVLLAEEQFEEKSNGNGNPLLSHPVNVGKEGRALDVFWFFKPCAHSSNEF